jgi:hypothetical protein
MTEIEEGNKMKIPEHTEAVAEELSMNGFDVQVVKDRYAFIIEHDTVAGKMKYQCSEKTIMGDYYRFLNHYGMKIGKYGLTNKLAQ